MSRGALVRQGMIDERWALLRGGVAVDDTPPADGYIPSKPNVSGKPIAFDVRGMNKVKILPHVAASDNQTAAAYFYGLHKDGQGDFIGKVTFQATTLFPKTFVGHTQDIVTVTQSLEGFWFLCDFVAIAQQGLYGFSALTVKTIGTTTPEEIVIDLDAGGWVQLEVYLELVTAVAACLIIKPIS